MSINVERFTIKAHRPKYGVSRNLILAGLAALVLSSFSVLGLFLYVHGSTPNPSDQLEIAMRLMRKGDGESPQRIAKSIDPKNLTKKVDLSRREFLLGAAERKATGGIVHRRIASERNELAVKHLKKSRDLAFPDGYEGLGNFFLGMALFDLFRWDEAKEPLEVAAERWPQGRADAIERLVDIAISFENHDPDSALARIEHWRSLPRSSGDEIERSVVKEMQALYSKGDFKKAAELLESVPQDSTQRPSAELVHGRCMQRLAERKEEPDRTRMLEAALSNFQNVLASGKSTVTVRRQSNLELGRVIKSMGKSTQAVSTFSALRLSSPYEPESLVSGLEEIDCLIDLGRISDASDTLEHITKNFGEIKWYQNDWIPLSDLRKKIVASGERMIDSHDYSEASRFANNLPPLCDEEDRLRMSSRLFEEWANREFDKQKDLARVRSHFIAAAEAYEALSAKLMKTPQYGELLWRAIENYRKSGAFKKSNALLENYLRFESRENQPKGLLAIARNHSALEQPNLAMMSLNRILESNTSTPLAYDARLEAARIRLAKEDYVEAEELLIQNLYLGDLTPSSPVWRDSLFLLSEVLYRRGLSLNDQASEAIFRDPTKSHENIDIVEKSYKELVRSILRIDEGLRRFESDPRRLEMIYTMAKAYQMASKWPDLLLRENRIANEDSIANWKSQKREMLVQARNAFSKLRQEITSTTDSSLNPISENLLRNSFFGEADLLFEEGSYEEAIVAYQEAAMRFISDPEALEAMIQISNSQNKLGKDFESRRTLEMAKDILSRIPIEKEAKFLVTSRNRAGWEQHIDWRLKELDKK